jgi:hypothetical protein
MNVSPGGLVVSVLATGPEVRGFDPDRGWWIFKGDKNPEHHFLRRESKAVAACKRTLRARIELVMPAGKIQRPFLTQVSWLPARWVELVRSVGWSPASSTHMTIETSEKRPPMLRDWSDKGLILWTHVKSVETKLLKYFTSTLDTGEWSDSRPSRFATEEKILRVILNTYWELNSSSFSASVCLDTTTASQFVSC